MVIADPDKELREFCDLIGAIAIAARVSELERLEKTFKPNSVYATCWFVPQNALWLTVRGARELWNAGRSINSVIDQVPRLGITAAALVNKVIPTMPLARRHKFDNDLIAAENVQAVLLELDTALQFMNLGYAIDWLDGTGKDGERCPEFIASRDELEIGVECKASSLDAGRLLLRKYACLLVDEVLDSLSQNRRLMGRVEIAADDTILASPQGRTIVAKAILDHADGKVQETVQDSFRIVLHLAPRDGTRVDLAAYISTQKNDEAAFGSYTVVSARQEVGITCDPITFQFGSIPADKVDIAIRDNLRKASDQLRALDKPGFIKCFVPEVENFEMPAAINFPRAIGDWFFSEPTRSHVLGIEFVSDDQIFDLGRTNFPQQPFVLVSNPNTATVTSAALAIA